MTPNNNDRQSRRSYRVTTSKGTSMDGDPKSLLANLRGKTPLIWIKSSVFIFILSNTTNYIYKRIIFSYNTNLT